MKPSYCGVSSGDLRLLSEVVLGCISYCEALDVLPDLIGERSISMIGIV